MRREQNGGGRRRTTVGRTGAGRRRTGAGRVRPCGRDQRGAEGPGGPGGPRRPRPTPRAARRSRQGRPRAAERRACVGSFSSGRLSFWRVHGWLERDVLTLVSGVGDGVTGEL